MDAKSKVWELIYGFANSMTLKCALQLGLPDLVHKNGGSMTLAQIVNSLPIRGSPDPDRVYRLMRFLVQNNLFTCTNDDGSDELKYGLTAESELLVKDSEKSLAMFALHVLHPTQITAWQHLIDGLYSSTYTWMEVYKFTWHESAVKDPQLLELYKQAMTGYISHVVDALVSGCARESVFDDSVQSILDLGGNAGIVAKAIVDAFPDIKCTVMDLPEVIAGPHIDHPRIVYMAGDAFSFVPKADVIFMKSFMHCFSDEECIKILKKCKEAIPPETGKVVVVEIAIDVNGFSKYSMEKLCMDMETMIVGGKERNQQDWKDMLDKAGFSQHKFISIDALESIIEARP